MLRLAVYRPGEVRLDVDPSQVSDLLGERGVVVWLDMENPTLEEMRCLSEEFAFHPLAIEDATKRHQRPKLDRYPTYDFFVLYDLDYDKELRAWEIDFFLGKNYVVTIHEHHVPHFDDFRARWVKQPGIVEPHPVAFLLYHLADETVDEYFPIMDKVGDRLEELESRLFDRFEEGVNKEIFQLKRDLLMIRRIVAPERDIFNLLSRRDQPIYDPAVAPYFTDIYDHLLRVADALDTYRDLLASALDAYLSLQSNRLNQIVKVLTVWSIVLMAMTTIASIYGMNFDDLLLRGLPFDYAVVILGMLGVGAALLLWFRRRGWL